jgi:hypothetical protein
MIILQVRCLLFYICFSKKIGSEMFALSNNECGGLVTIFAFVSIVFVLF